jgi:tRNA(fMet)-specific endonuclease VapC
MKPRYLLDTGPMGDFIDHRHGVDTRARHARLHGARIGTCMPVIGELYFGMELSSNRDENLKMLKRALAGIVCWPFDLRAAEEYGRVAAELRRMGRPMQQIDIQVAAIALSLGNCTVVTGDSDLSDVPGLTVENWAT